MNDLNTVNPEKKSYGGAAIKLIILTMVTYMVSYLGRKSWNSNITEIMDYFFDGKGEDLVGLVGTCFFVSYAIGQVVHGILCGKYNPKWIVSGALILASLCNILVGIMPKDKFYFIKYIWIVNGFAMATLWSVMIRLLNLNLAKKHIKSALFAMSFPVSCGYFLSYGLTSLFSALKVFRFSFYTAAILMTLCAVIWFLTIDGLMSRCKQEKIETDGEESLPVESSSKKEKGKVAKSFYVLFAILAVFAIVDNLLKDGLVDWTPAILKQKYELANWASILLAVAMPAVAILGTMGALWLSKKIPNYITLCGLLFVVVLITLVALIFSFKLPTWIIPFVLMVLIYVLMSGINNVITNIFPLQCDKNVNAGMIAGLIDGFCYVGSAISSYGLGFLKTKVDNWDVMFYLFAVLSAVCVVLAVVSLFINRKKKNI